MVRKSALSAAPIREGCLPRAFIVTHVEPVTDWEEAQARLAAGFDPAEGALVEGELTLNGPPGHSVARVRRHSPNHVIVEAEPAQPALLVLSEIWYPGWRVTVDGVEQQGYRVDGIVRGVYLDPGAHMVTWQYRPVSLRWGAALTVGALAAWIVGSVLWHR